MKLNSILFYLLFCMNIIAVFSQTEKTVSAKDFDILTGNWYGSLTYLDYSTDKPYTMAADLNINRIVNENRFIFMNTYPKEPEANSIDTFVISKDGKMIGSEKVESIVLFDNGKKEIITQYEDKDGNENKTAVIRHTYKISNDTFTIRKDVQFEGQTVWINRHEYSYTRVKP